MFVFSTNGSDRIGERLPARRLVLRDRHVAQKDLDLRQNALRNRLAGDRKRTGMRRMAMHDALHVGPLPIDLQVQQRLARPLLDAGELLARHVDQANILGLEKPFAVHRRRAQDFVLAHANGNVAVVGGRETLGVNPPPDFADVLFELV